MSAFNATYKYVMVILLGLIIFLLDYFELANPVSNEVVLFVLSVLKSAYFIYFVFSSIKETANRTLFFQEFMSFVVISILLVIVSFSIDYYCLFRINHNAFSGIIPKENILTEFVSFFYYSISVFTTAGFGDIKPNSSSSQIFVSTELMIAFFFTVLIIANITHIRGSFSEKSKHS